MVVTDTAAGIALDAAAARRFADDHIVPRAERFDREGRVPDEFLRQMSRAGLWAPFLPPEFGGAGLSFTELGRVHAEIGRGCSSVRSLLTVHTMLAWAVNRWGTEDQRARWLAPLARGDLLGAVCITEPEAGSDTAGLAATATRAAGGWRLTGTKKWITGGQRADVFLAYARAGSGLAAFLVPRGTPGVEVEPLADILGTRASMLATVRFRDVEVASEALLGPASFVSGLVLSSMLDIGRYSVAAGSLGIIEACLDACAAYTSARSVGGSMLRDLQLIRAKISDMVTDAAAGRLLVEQAGRLKDDGDPRTVMATWIAKYFTSTAAARHASAAVQIHGANGCGPGYPVARYYRDAKVMEIIEGSTEIQQLTIANTAYWHPSPGSTSVV